jgi:hypothetical protein
MGVLVHSACFFVTFPDESSWCPAKHAGSRDPSAGALLGATSRNDSLCAAPLSSVNRRVAGSSPAAGALPARKRAGLVCCTLSFLYSSSAWCTMSTHYRRALDSYRKERVQQPELEMRRGFARLQEGRA